MLLTAHIINTAGHRLATLDVQTPSPGLDRPTIYAAEQAAHDWARENNRQVVADIVSDGQYRAWVK